MRLSIGKLTFLFFSFTKVKLRVRDTCHLTALQNVFKARHSQNKTILSAPAKNTSSHDFSIQNATKFMPNVYIAVFEIVRHFSWKYLVYLQISFSPNLPIDVLINNWKFRHNRTFK